MFFFKYLLPLKQSFVIINKYGCKLSLIKQTKIKTVLLCYTTLSNKQEQSYTILFLWIQIKKNTSVFILNDTSGSGLTIKNTTTNLVVLKSKYYTASQKYSLNRCFLHRLNTRNLDAAFVIKLSMILFSIMDQKKTKEKFNNPLFTISQLTGPFSKPYLNDCNCVIVYAMEKM